MDGLRKKENVSKHPGQEPRCLSEPDLGSDTPSPLPDLGSDTPSPLSDLGGDTPSPLPDLGSDTPSPLPYSLDHTDHPWPGVGGDHTGVSTWRWASLGAIMKDGEHWTTPLLDDGNPEFRP